MANFPNPQGTDCHDQCAHWSRNDSETIVLPCHREERSDVAIFPNPTEHNFSYTFYHNSPHQKSRETPFFVRNL